MITKTEERTNDQMCKVCKKINADEFLFRFYSAIDFTLQSILLKNSPWKKQPMSEQ